jgi:tetratricopeptide (TPR) repeat protein
MLAKSSLLTEDYPRAGEKYEDVLRENLFRVWPGDIPPFRQALYENAARCYELAERPERAESLLKACLDELPKSKGVWLKLARLHTQPPHTDYKAAYEALRQELEADPDAGEDVRMSVALTLGAIGSEGHALKQAVEQYVDRNPQQFDLTKSLVRANWPGFASLSEQAQVEWAEASWELWGLATQVQTQPTGIYRMAAQTFGLAVECELRERLYLPFREQIKRLPHVMNSAKEGLKDEATRELCRFLIDDRHLTLGPMLNAIDASRCRPRLEFLKELSRYLEKDFANLVKNFPLLKWKRLNQLYNSSKHELGGLKTEAEEMHSLCRRFLSCLTGSVSG